MCSSRSEIDQILNHEPAPSSVSMIGDCQQHLHSSSEILQTIISHRKPGKYMSRSLRRLCLHQSAPFDFSLHLSIHLVCRGDDYLVCGGAPHYSASIEYHVQAPCVLYGGHCLCRIALSPGSCMEQLGCCRQAWVCLKHRPRQSHRHSAAC